MTMAERESYQPSPEEMKQAKDRMNFFQRRLSTEREDQESLRQLVRETKPEFEDDKDAQGERRSVVTFELQGHKVIMRPSKVKEGVGEVVIDGVLLAGGPDGGIDAAVFAVGLWDRYYYRLLASREAFTSSKQDIEAANAEVQREKDKKFQQAIETARKLLGL